MQISLHEEACCMTEVYAVYKFSAGFCNNFHMCIEYIMIAADLVGITPVCSPPVAFPQKGVF